MRKNPNQFYTKNCQICESEFKCGNKRQRTCSRVCMGKQKQITHRVLCICLFCRKTFAVTFSAKAEGRGKFCSSKCFHSNSRKSMPEIDILSLWDQGLSCVQIATRLKLNRTALKRWLTEQGIYETRRKGKNHGLFRGNCSRTVRADVFQRANHRCERCGYCEYLGILQIHHKDRNRRNNIADNLELLCPNCHEIDHLLQNDGRYQKSHPCESKAVS